MELGSGRESLCYFYSRISELVIAIVLLSGLKIY